MSVLILLLETWVMVQRNASTRMATDAPPTVISTFPDLGLATVAI